MRELNVEQGSPEWFAARQGVITGTKAADLFARGAKGQWLKSRQNAIYNLAMQRLESEAMPPATGGALRRGNDYEDQAVHEYEFWSATETEVCGFALHPEVNLWGCSPDRMIGDDGVLEIKVPTSVEKHVAYLLDPQSLLEEYEGQCRHNLFITGRNYIEIASYHPEARTPHHLAIARMERPENWDFYIDMLSAADLEIERVIDELNKSAAA